MAICGRSPKLLYACFELIPRNEGVKMGFEEFRRILMSKGLGQDLKDARALFLALGGSSGYADIDTLINFLGPSATMLSVVDITKKKPPALNLSISAVDRRLREGVRRTYKVLKQELEEYDERKNGFVDSEALLSILNRKCCPITHQDFRYIIQLLKTDERGFLNWHQFLQIYHPSKAIHVLDGASAAIDFAKSIDLASKAAAIEKIKQAQQQTEQDELLQPRAQTAFAGDAIVMDLRRKWTLALRECQRSDPQRTGIVSRVFFIAALEFAQLGKTMNPDFMNKLADTYTVRDGNVDYLTCFRNYLNEIISQMPTKKADFTLQEKSKPRDSGALHPWEFGYTRERKQINPYWQKATMPKPETAPMQLSIGSSFSTVELKKVASTTSMGYTLSDSDREIILAKYEPKIISICAKCNEVFMPIWRAVRNEFKRSQINGHKGCVITPVFCAILEHFGVKLSATAMGTVTRAFRSTGMLQDVVKYDEFLRVCLVSRGLKKDY